MAVLLFKLNLCEGLLYVVTLEATLKKFDDIAGGRCA